MNPERMIIRKETMIPERMMIPKGMMIPESAILKRIIPRMTGRELKPVRGMRLRRKRRMDFLPTRFSRLPQQGT